MHEISASQLDDSGSSDFVTDEEDAVGIESTSLELDEDEDVTGGVMPSSGGEDDTAVVADVCKV